MQRWSAAMAKIFIPYSTGEGQTAKIAQYVADVITAHGHEAHTADIRQSEGTVPTGYDGVIVGASVHMGKHDKHAVDYVRNNRTALEQLQSALFSVSLAAHGDTEEAAGYVEEFEHDTGWRPVRIALFGGALLYSQYGFLKRHMMKKIASGKPGNLDTDTSHDYVYTEWDGVKRFAEDFLEELTSGGVRKGSPEVSAERPS
jgi:menaquinone-dependent protoporphyrinogen oxidase